MEISNMKRFTLILISACCLLSSLTNAWAGNHPYFSKHPQQEKKLEQLLRQTKMQALELQPADLSVPLKDLKGQAYDLSTQRGKVLMLSRWATWCGACKSEMPFKQKLRQNITDKRFMLVGISGEDQETVADFHKQGNNIFDVSLLDPNNVMGKFFPGGAIPVTIIVDGWGWVIALQQGAARWDSPPFVQLIRFLASVAPRKEQLKEKAPAPVVQFAKQMTVKSNAPFQLTFSLSWRGEPDKYARLSFRLPKQKGLRMLGVSSSSTSASKRGNTRTYTINLQAEKAGTYTLDPILLNYWLKDYDQHFQKALGKVSLSVDAAGSVLAPKKKIPVWAYGLLGAAVLLLFVFLVLAKRQGGQQDEALSPEEERKLAQQKQLETFVEKAVSSAKEKQFADFLDALVGIQKIVEKEEQPALRTLAESIRYGGQAPKQDVLAEHTRHTRQLLRTPHPQLASKLESLF
ncbi:MAG TPA: hypothetical protein DCE42_12885 [Myxococcales bacterium]|nr:hypothetical protein [Myxococcales bacterium]